jgi:hypothetical protein
MEDERGPVIQSSLKESWEQITTHGRFAVLASLQLEKGADPSWDRLIEGPSGESSESETAASRQRNST